MSLIFLDLETTGLDPALGMILEVAACAVSPTLEPTSGFAAVISPRRSGLSLPPMDSVVIEMHQKNGLFAALDVEGHDFANVYGGLREWLETQGPGPHTLAGDSVHFDYRWLLNEMPHVAKMFSHRLLDVSAFRVARELRGLPPCDIVGPAAHRAQADVLASIAKARWHLSRITP